MSACPNFSSRKLYAKFQLVFEALQREKEILKLFLVPRKVSSAAHWMVSMVYG